MSIMKYIAYYRVSTQKQGRSGLGLEAQQASVEAYLRTHPGEILASYTDVETGKHSNRPQLQAALAHAKRAQATLLVAKLDRLARNVHFISGLMESGVPFDCADRPGADPFRLHIEAAIAEEECRKISSRTKAALEAAKARGVKLGSAREGHWVGREHLRAAALAKGRETQRQRSKFTDTLPVIKQLREEGRTLQFIVDWLNEQGRTNSRGQSFTLPTLQRLIARTLGSEYLGCIRSPLHSMNS